MTHLLIPIKDIEKQIAELRTRHNTYARKKADSLERLIKTSKQISLNEEDIEEKINLLYPEPHANDSIQIVYKWSGKKEGYKQALKDLL